MRMVSKAHQGACTHVLPLPCCVHMHADLSISEDGFLIDNKTGKVINEFGATRFDVAVRAMRDELSPPEWVEVSSWVCTDIPYASMHLQHCAWQLQCVCVGHAREVGHVLGLDERHLIYI